MLAPSATTPACSGRSPTWPSRKASTPSRSCRLPQPPRATEVAGARGRGTAEVAVAPEEPTMTDLSKTQLTTILSAIDGERRSPANKDAALKALGKSAERLGLTTDAVLAAAPGLLDGRLDAEAWRA